MYGNPPAASLKRLKLGSACETTDMRAIKIANKFAGPLAERQCAENGPATAQSEQFKSRTASKEAAAQLLSRA